MEWYVWLIVQNYIMLNDGYSVLYFLSNCARCYVFCYAWKTLIMDACSCVHMYLQSLQIFPWSCFLKEKIILLSKESSLLEKKKNIYCAFPDMKEIIIKKSVKTGETASRLINFV